MPPRQQASRSARPATSSAPDPPSPAVAWPGVTVTAPTDDRIAQLEHRLRTDEVFYARKLLKIVDQKANLVPLVAKPAQARLAAVEQEQRDKGLPVRVAILKARREGLSTWVQGGMVKGITQVENYKALVVAHDGDTASELFRIGETMYANLPDETVGNLQLRPPTVSTRKGQELVLGEPNRQRRLNGERGINSSYYVDTANEYEAARGFTFFDLHLSEVAFWKEIERKLRALLATVPDEEGTRIILESTANGYNAWRKFWLAAISGNSDYYPLFIAWFEDPDYSRPFADEEEREAFIAKIGTGPFGEDEPDLLELGVTVEQLNWRRWAIVNRCHGDLRAFWQEFPANWEEAFLSSGRQVFAPALTAKVMARTEEIEASPARQAKRGLIRSETHDTRNYMGNEIKVPTAPFWLPDEEAGDEVGVATPRWEIWEMPFFGREAREEIEEELIPPGQYVMTVDSASGAETVSEGQDYFVIQVINHRTRAQCAQWRARGIDADLVAREAFKAALFYAPEFRPWLAVEVTGGYGVSIATKLYRQYGYANLYFRNPAEQKGEKPVPVLGFSMDTRTKPLVVDNAKELLRDGLDGIASKLLASEMQTFVRDEKGKMGAEEDYFDDLLDAWMVAQYIAFEKPVRRSRWKVEPERAKGPGARRPPSLSRRPRRYGRR